MPRSQPVEQAEPSTALVTTQALVPAVVFAEGGVDAVIDKIRREVATVEIDISTPKGRADCASLAYKIARSKTALDAMGKELGEDSYRAWKRITGERAKIERELDALRDKVRKPLTDWENADKERIAAHEEAIADIEALAHLPDGWDSAVAQERLDHLNTLDDRDWQEFAKRASDAKAAAFGRLTASHAEAVKREAEAAETERLRKEEEDRKRRDRDAAIAAAAAEQARLAAEAKAKAEAEAAAAKAKAEREAVEAKARSDAAAAEQARQAEEQARRDAEARAARAEAERKAFEEHAERERIAAAQQAERDRLAAVEAERRRQEADRQAEAAAAAQREANTRHRAKINGEAVAALVEHAALTQEQARSVIVAIARHEVPAVAISY